MKSAKSIIYCAMLLLAFAVTACSDDTFSTDSSKSLDFAADTIKFDTIFSTVPSQTQSLWVYNRSGANLKCSTVRLERGNQTGFRVNVDGTYLGQTTGYATTDIEIRDNDSIRIFAEATLPTNYKDGPTRVEDNLVFTLESGKQQKICLSAFSWDAQVMHNVVVSNDSTIAYQGKPIVIYGGITVDEGATLTIDKGATLYFHSGSGIDVYGRLVCNGEPDNEVTLRGDRLDNMFSYLTYNEVSGQWKGIHLYEKSYGNTISYTDIHGTFSGIVADSSDINQKKLDIESSTVHNCQGYGIKADCSNISIKNCQITNTLNDCLFVNGGKAEVNNTTMAQFYPFDSNRGYALHFAPTPYPLSSLVCNNSIITGYANDVLLGESSKDSLVENNFTFSHCLIRTPKIETDDSLKFVSVIFEDVKDTIVSGKKNFRLVDGKKQKYDFRLDSVSLAIGLADKATAMPLDRKATRRDDQPDAGAYEYVAPDEKQ